ncbi:MAG TPA: ABC transporter substrate-binding protein [Candidatus Babeliales bacterium]|jgi:putative ABC transport system substrate-binding protein|nr:ABC transporter substrate-binding protein [Candidatus Babeliales bacterium]
MNYRNIILSLLTIGLVIVGIIVTKTVKKQNNPLLTIGILQTASHPALDAAREGFIDELNAHLDNIDYIIHNAQGSITTAHTIAERFHADDSIDAIYAIATPALQAVASIEKEKPIFIAAVTDPHALGIITKHTNICGTTDMVDIPGTIRGITTLLPEVTTIALIYNPSETNSIAQINLMEKELHRYNIATVRVGVATEMEIPQAVATALSKADALLTPTDNLIASAMPLVAHLAHQAHKPLIACHNQAVEQGALMARGVDYYESGKETGEIALAVLRDKKKPYNIPIRPTKSDTIVVNKHVIDELNITIAPISDTIIYINSKQGN